MTLIQDSDIVFKPLDNLLNLGNKLDEVRDCSLALSVHKPRSLSMSSSKCDKEYYIYVKRDSDRMNENEPATSVDNIQIECVSQKRRNGQVSKVANSINNMCNQHVSNENLALSLLSGNNMFNVQLNYDID